MKSSLLPYYKNMYALCMSIMKCREDIVEDVLQETYIEVYEKYKLPFGLYSENLLIEAAKKRCLKALGEMRKSPSRPIGTIKVFSDDGDGGEMDSEFYLDFVTWKKAVCDEANFEVSFKVAEEQEERDPINEFIEKNKSIKELKEQKELPRHSSRFFTDKAKEEWRQKRLNYLNFLNKKAAQTVTGNYLKVMETIKEYLGSAFPLNGEMLRLRPGPKSKFTDIEVICLKITSYCMGIDSEMYLMGIIKDCAQDEFLNIVSRRQFNDRCRSLSDHISPIARYVKEKCEHNLRGCDQQFSIKKRNSMFNQGGRPSLLRET